MSIRKSLDSKPGIPNSHLLAQVALTVFKNAGAVFEDLVKDPEGKNSDLVVLVCDVQARDRRALTTIKSVRISWRVLIMAK